MREQVVDGPSPLVLPAYALPRLSREDRVLYVLTKGVAFHTSFGIQRIPAGYVTDFASIPRLAAWRIHPLSDHAWAALLHDWRYAIGEPGKKNIADQMFRERMEIDKVNAVRRKTMYEAVHLFGGGGYEKAKTWWPTENFRDRHTGMPVIPPCQREDAFDGQPWGLELPTS